MRTAHMSNPLHRFEHWTGETYRKAESWEVGSYILITHHVQPSVCPSLQSQIKYLEDIETSNDNAEENALRAQISGNSNNGIPDPHSEKQPNTPQFANDEELVWQRSLKDLQRSHATMIDDDEAENEAYTVDENDEAVHDDFDVEMARYLDSMHGHYSREGPELSAPEKSAGPTFGPEPLNDATAYRKERQTFPGSHIPPNTDALNNSYVRVVHTNGLHNLAMVHCGCRGENGLLRDLIACQLLPASFHTIRTVFSTQLLDYFRLCNLELKASAYQFYQLLRRLTRPMGPGEVVDLYNEFRRMSRFWRWMKKLKWAGYGQNGKHHSDVAPGSLANFCPACPQPHVNLPPNWKDNVDR
jgi:CxC2 like cysteine cluster associated with KDZ transposases